MVPFLPSIWLCNWRMFQFTYSSIDWKLRPQICMYKGGFCRCSAYWRTIDVFVPSPVKLDMASGVLCMTLDCVLCLNGAFLEVRKLECASCFVIMCLSCRLWSKLIKYFQCRGTPCRRCILTMIRANGTGFIYVLDIPFLPCKPSVKRFMIKTSSVRSRFRSDSKERCLENARLLLMCWDYRCVFYHLCLTALSGLWLPYL